MPEHFADRLLAAIEETGSPVCVGLDPAVDRIPAPVAEEVRDLFGGAWDDMDEDVRAVHLLYHFCLDVIGAVADLVPAVKPQIAYFERYGSAGVAMYEAVQNVIHDIIVLVSYWRSLGYVPGPRTRRTEALRICYSFAPFAILSS